MKNKVIIINGPCGVGKSTTTLKLHENMPLSFLLNIDGQRGFVSQRRKYRKESGEVALAVAESILETCLNMNTDVIIDKMLFDEKVIDKYYEIAEKYDANVYEIILWAPKNVVVKRADDRGYIDEPGAFTRERCEYFWDEIDKVKSLRKNAHIVDTEKLSKDETFEKVSRLIKEV